MSAESQVERGARGPYRNGVKRRRAIVTAAATAFGQYGYHGASLRQIARAGSLSICEFRPRCVCVSG